MTVGSEYVAIGPMVLVLCPSVLVLNLVVLLTSLQDALDRRRGELTRSAHPDPPHLARQGEPTPNTLSVIYRYAAASAWAALIGCMLPVLVALILRYWLPVFYTVHVFVGLLRVKSV